MRNVLVGVANQNEKSMKVDDIQDWEVEKVSYVGTSTYFKIKEEDGFYSMDRGDFNEIFGHKINK